MLFEIELDVLRFLGRTTLEGLQIHSRYLRDLVNRHAHALPLHYAYEVTTLRGNISFRLSPDDNDEIYVEQLGERDPAALFHRVHSAFVHRLNVSVLPEDLDILYYLPPNGDDLQCHIDALCIRAFAVPADYALIHFLGVHLKPQVCATTIYRGAFEDSYAVLFTHNALRDAVTQTQMVHQMSKTCARAPDCIIPELFVWGGAAETCAITTHVDPRPWIFEFVQTFETDQRGMDIVRSVTLLHLRYGDASPMGHTSESHGQPLRSDAPTPHSDFIEEWSQEKHREGFDIAMSPVAELFVSENANAGKKLEIFVWTIEQAKYDAAFGLHYAFFLRVTDM